MTRFPSSPARRSMASPVESRRLLALSLAPVLALIVLAALPYLRLPVTLRDAPHPQGGMTRVQAAAATERLIGSVGGHRVVVRDASPETARSRRLGVVPEWFVLCDSGTRTYFVRINATTGHVFGVNTIRDTGKPASERITRQTAMARVRWHLAALRAQPDTLKLRNVSSLGIYGDTPRWDMTFERKQPGGRSHIVSISIDGSTGDLVHFWDPGSLRRDPVRQAAI